MVVNLTNYKILAPFDFLVKAKKGLIITCNKTSDISTKLAIAEQIVNITAVIDAYSKSNEFRGASTVAVTQNQ